MNTSPEPTQNIFMIGIAGSGMRGLAHILHEQGHTISGTDEQYANIVNTPEFEAFALAPESSSTALVEASSIVVFSDAVVEQHPLRVLARQTSKQELPYQEALGLVAQQYTTLAVTGTHGKSSTTAFLAHIFIEHGLDPTVLIGATVPAWGNKSSRFGHGEYFIVEADEYREHFSTLHPEHAIITTIDFDHPDYFTSIEDTKKAYETFMLTVSLNGTTIVPQHLHEVYPDIAWPSNTQFVDTEQQSNLSLVLPGKHMRANALLAIALAKTLGIPEEKSVQYLQSFQGLGKRFEILGHFGSCEIVSDYGHHPEEISTTLNGAREKYPDAKILAVFEAHMIERLQSFGPAFADALSLADGVLTCPVFLPKGREGESTHKEISALQAALQEKGTPHSYIATYEELPAELEKQATSYDVAIGFSAGLLDAQLRALPLNT